MTPRKNASSRGKVQNPGTPAPDGLAAVGQLRTDT